MKLFEEFRNKLELLENLIKEKITEEIPPQFEKILQELEVYKASFSEILQNSKNSEIYIQNTKNNNELQEKYGEFLYEFLFNSHRIFIEFFINFFYFRLGFGEIREN